MPAELEFMVRETRNWFARSPLRRLQYQDLYQAINRGDQPAALVQLSSTRWLAWGKAIVVVLDQWVPLKAHYQQAVLAAGADPKEKCVIGRRLRDCYDTEAYKLLLLFLQPITQEVNKVNMRFQADDAEVRN